MADWLLLQDGPFIYLALILMLLGGAIGLPIPEDLPLLLAGVLLHLEKVRLELVIPLCYLGVISGDILIFSVGRFMGPALFQKSWFKKRFPPSKVRLVRKNLERRSLSMILIARHLFYLRTATFLICGAVRMSPAKFIASDSLAALISLPIMVGIGFVAAEHINAIIDGVHKTKHFVVLAAILIGFVFCWYKIRSGGIEKALEGSESTEEKPRQSALE